MEYLCLTRYLHTFSDFGCCFISLFWGHFWFDFSPVLRCLFFILFYVTFFLNVFHILHLSSRDLEKIFQSDGEKKTKKNKNKFQVWLFKEWVNSSHRKSKLIRLTWLESKELFISKTVQRVPSAHFFQNSSFWRFFASLFGVMRIDLHFPKEVYAL